MECFREAEEPICRILPGVGGPITEYHCLPPRQDRSTRETSGSSIALLPLLELIKLLVIQAVNQATVVHQLKTTHKQELEATEAKNQSTIQTLTASHESKTNSITKDLVEMQALTTRLDAQLHMALNENTALKSSNARLAELESSQSTTITDLTAQLESTSNQLKDASAEKKSAQDRLAATEAELESISTRLYDAVREHTAVVRQKDDMITRNSEKVCFLGIHDGIACLYKSNWFDIDERLGSRAGPTMRQDSRACNSNRYLEHRD